MSHVRRAAAELKRNYKATRVVLFGSLAEREWFTDSSDVDLAVEGIGDRYWEAWRRVEEIIEGRAVDLVDIESATPSLRRSIEQYGIEL